MHAVFPLIELLSQVSRNAEKKGQSELKGREEHWDPWTSEEGLRPIHTLVVPSRPDRVPSFRKQPLHPQN